MAWAQANLQKSVLILMETTCLHGAGRGYRCSCRPERWPEHWEDHGLILKRPLRVQKAVFSCCLHKCSSHGMRLSNPTGWNTTFSTAQAIQKVAASMGIGSKAVSIGSSVVRLLGSQKLTHNQRLPSFLGETRLDFRPMTWKARINPLARLM